MKIIHPREIRSLRTRLGLTQAQLAERAGVTQAYIAKIESGDADPKISTLERISKTLRDAADRNETTAEDVMEKPIISVSSDDKTRKAIRLMESNDISQIPVLKERKQVGSLSEETILHGISDGEDDLVETEVRKVMDDPFPAISKEGDLETVFHLLKHNQAVLVLEKGEPVGIITKADILRLSTH